MLNIKEFSSIAFYVYRDMKEIIKFMPNVVYERKQYIPHAFYGLSKHANGIFEVILDDLIQNPNNLSNNFYGSIFVKVQNHRATSLVIGIRGTVASIPGNDWADIHSWWKSVFDDNANINLPTHFVLMATRLCHLALRFAHEKLNLTSSNVFVTGHSLGGAIAGLIPTKVRLPIRAVTFNAPGIKEIPGVANVPSQVINIRSEYDFVSALAEPIGPVWNVPVPEEEQAAQRSFELSEERTAHPVRERLIDPENLSALIESTDFLKSALAQHKMLNLWQAMKHTNIEPQTYANFEGVLNMMQQRYARVANKTYHKYHQI